MNREHIGQVAIVIFRPQVLVIRGIDQLHVHAHTIANTANAAFQNGSDAERFSYFTNVGRFSPIRHDGGARDNFQVANLRQIREHVVLNPVGEVGVFFLGAEIFKWQHRNRLVDLAR